MRRPHPFEVEDTTPSEPHRRSVAQWYGRALFACQSLEGALALVVDETTSERDHANPEAPARTFQDLVAAFAQRYGHTDLYHELQRFLSDRQAMTSIALTIKNTGQPDSEATAKLIQQLSEIERNAIRMRQAIRSEATKHPIG